MRLLHLMVWISSLILKLIKTLIGSRSPGLYHEEWPTVVVFTFRKFCLIISRLYHLTDMNQTNFKLRAISQNDLGNVCHIVGAFL